MVSQALSLFGRVSLVLNILVFVLPSALRKTVTAATRAWIQRLPIGASIWNGFARSLMTNLPPHQIQALLPSTIDTYRSWMTSAGKSPLVQVLSDGSTRLLWQKTGGHLAPSLLSHLHNPRPEQGKINLTAPIKGRFLVSPLTSFNLANRSYEQRFSADVLSKTIVRKWGDYLINNSPWQQGIAEGNGWGMALDVPEMWWDGLDAVDQIMVTAGHEKVFRDHVLQLVGVFRRRFRAKVEWLVPVAEAHDGPLMDFSAKRSPSATTDRITK